MPERLENLSGITISRYAGADCIITTMSPPLSAPYPQRTKFVATLLLIVVLALFLVSTIFEPRYPWLSWLKSFSEAASVGAIADWFAVTALFRHPLGIPIPHTAIIANQRDRLARGLGEFIDNNFLSGDVLKQKIVSGNMSLAIAQWTSQDKHSKNIAAIGKQIIERSLWLFEDTSVANLIKTDFGAALGEAQLSPFCGRMLRLTVESDTEQEISAAVIALIDRFLNSNADTIEDFVSDKLPWYVPGFLHRPTFRQILTKIRDEMSEIEKDPRHPARGKFRAQLLRLAEQLEENELLIQKGEKVKRLILESAFFEQYVVSFTQKIGASLRQQFMNAESPLWKTIDSAAQRLLAQIKEDRALQSALNEWLFDIVTGLVSHSSLNFSALVQDVVGSWDTKTLVARIEAQVSSDLQYIRINGTVIGGLVGLLLHVISRVSV